MKKVLLVEDEAHIRHLVQLILEGAGFEVFGVPTLNDALELLAKGRPDVIVTDKHLDDRDGNGVIEESRRLYPESLVPVVLLSGSSSVLGKLADGIESENGVHYMSKPFNIDFLRQKIEVLTCESASAV